MKRITICIAAALVLTALSSSIAFTNTGILEENDADKRMYGNGTSPLQLPTLQQPQTSQTDQMPDAISLSAALGPLFLLAFGLGKKRLRIKQR